MKYKDFIESYVGKPVKIGYDCDTGIYTISPTSVDPDKPFNRNDILEVHDDFVVIKKYITGGAPDYPARYSQKAIPIYMIEFAF